MAINFLPAHPHKRVGLSIKKVNIMHFSTLKKIALFSISALSFTALADESAIDTLWINGSIENTQTLSGSAQKIDEIALEQLNTADIHEVVTKIPGVYVREEDGYGLRPNIGIRGAASERSQNITLMEDGILIKPAPYAAPAAYYFPNVARAQGIDVFKGPSAVKYGPRTVGGAINIVTRSAEAERNGFVDLSYGSDEFVKLHAVYGDKLSDNINYLVDALSYSASGFKELDNGEDTGFTRNDVNLRFNWTPEVSGSTVHQFDVKLGFADEESDETYLGLSDADFAANPVRRYIGSSLDEFKSDHQQIHLMHLAQFDSGLQLNTKLYLNEFSRSWNKFDGFASPNALLDQVDPSDVLRNPLVNREFFGLLTGELNSADLLINTNAGLDVTDNDRDYRSQGIQVEARQTFQHQGWTHKVEAGVRIHKDYVERNHSGRAYEVVNQTLVDNGFSFTKDLNKSESTALAAYLIDNIKKGQWHFDAGLRLVDISSDFSDFLDSSRNSSNDEQTVLAGAGVFHQTTERFGLLAGIHRGFSPAGPAAAGETADPEESVNVEFGTRYQSPEWSWEAIGFVSDYSNLIGRCRASDPCTAGSSFNGGSVLISGLEFNTSYERKIGDFGLPINFNYTFTDSEFQDNFESGFSQWGIVNDGDELPYTPEHVARLDIGLTAYNWDTNIAFKHRGDMRERAGQGTANADFFIKALTTIDWTGNYYVDDQLSLQLKVSNLSDKEQIVSRRPFGARPNQSRNVLASVKYRF